MLPGRQKTDLLTIRRIATAEGKKYRARRGLTLPDTKLPGKTERTTKSQRLVRPHQPSTSGRMSGKPTLSSLRNWQGPWEDDPYADSFGTTGSYANAFEHTPIITRGTDFRIPELDISNRDRGGAPPLGPLLTE